MLTKFQNVLCDTHNISMNTNVFNFARATLNVINGENFLKNGRPSSLLTFYYRKSHDVR